MIALAALAPAALMADVASLPVKTVNGKSYHYYEVQPRETIYSLVRQLGITTEELYRTNPSVRDGLKAYSVLLFPVGDAVSAPTSSAATHKVAKGETIYGISKKYGVTKDQLFEWNPKALDGLKAGQVIYVSDPNAAAQNRTEATPLPTTSPIPTPAPAPATETIPYKVRKGETFYSIARANDLTPAELEAVNPGIGAVRQGDTIQIPVRSGNTRNENDVRPNEQSLPTEVVSSDSTATTEATDPAYTRPSIDIALMLPLMTSQSNRPKESALFTEYLKGFLMAVDSLRNEGTPINITVVDTHGSADSVRTALSDGRLAKCSLIVAPDSEPQLKMLAEYGRTNNVYIFNPFVVKDDSYLSNPFMMQANIPQHEMYEKAIDGIITRYAAYKPVFLNRLEGAADKSAFITAMKRRFKEAGIEFTDLPYDTRLSRSDLNTLAPGRPLLFIPTSGRQAEANKIFPALIDYKDAGNDIVVFGFPEWTTFRGETLANMHSLEAVVYSRFVTDPSENLSKDVDERFRYWYGNRMSNVLPRQGLLGFDNGMYLIRAMLANGSDFSQPVTVDDGVQNGYNFIKPEGAPGLVNDVLYFIKFESNGSIDRTRL